MPNERLRDILPLLRPRSAEPTLFTQVVFYLLCLGIAILVSLYALRRYRLRQRAEAEFLAQAQSLDLSADDMALVRRVARQRGLANPGRLLSSAQAFDRHVGAYATALARRRLDHPTLEHIASLRRHLGFEGVPDGQALTSTRQIERGLTAMVWEDWHEEEQYCPWLVLDLDEGSLTIGPLLRGQEEHVDAIEVGDELSVRFWREGDTEYRFHSPVVQVDEASGAYRLAHADRVERMQQRDFFRIPVDFPVALYSLPEAPEVQQPQRAAEEAAIAELNRQIDEALETPAAPDPVPGYEAPAEDGDEAAAPAGAGTGPGEPPLDLSQSECLEGRAVDLSAGGMALLVATPGPATHNRWVFDPEFTGDFALAGVTCQIVGETLEAGQRRLKLQFDGLSPAAESDIVRQVYQCQLLAAEGRDGETPGASPPDGPGGPAAPEAD